GDLDLIAGENKFYFRCKGSSGNANGRDYIYNLKLSNTKLDISNVNCEYILPDGVSGSDCANVYARNFTMVVNTAGGVDGRAKCRYSGLGSGEFFETDSTTSKQQFGGDGSLSSGFSPGSYSLNIKCADEAENSAEKIVDINIKVDNNNPKITRFYTENNNLYVLTDEYAKCYYTNTREFKYDKATLMSSDGTKHNTAISNSYYRVGCVDRFNNYMTPVSIYL
ncbi:MAG: hypothetical protein Q8N88_05575, partial [Nanoarchaeota archaeon]|nr:hypothetical protein [Nanoarchaeota archaeon]